MQVTIFFVLVKVPVCCTGKNTNVLGNNPCLALFLFGTGLNFFVTKVVDLEKSTNWYSVYSLITVGVFYTSLFFINYFKQSSQKKIILNNGFKYNHMILFNGLMIYIIMDLTYQG
jgi:hypothetical protein